MSKDDTVSDIKELAQNLSLKATELAFKEQSVEERLSQRSRWAMDKIADEYGFTVSFELEEDESVDDVYSEWREHVNISATDLKKWSKNPCSRQASVDPAAVIKRNLRLLEKNKSDWTADDVKDAKRTISFISRMKAQQPDEPREGPHGCPSEWAISLLNWAYNPFDSVPTPSSEVKDELDPVDVIELQELQDGGANYEFEPVPDHVVYADRETALQRAESMGLDGVHEHVLVLDGEEVTMYMPGSEHMDWAEKVNHPRQLESSENSETRKASQVFHADQERHKQNIEEAEDDSVSVPPVAIHQVEDGELETADNVDGVLEEMWDDNSE